MQTKVHKKIKRALQFYSDSCRHTLERELMKTYHGLITLAHTLYYIQQKRYKLYRTYIALSHNMRFIILIF